MLYPQTRRWRGGLPPLMVSSQSYDRQLKVEVCGAPQGDRYSFPYWYARIGRAEVGRKGCIK